MTTLDATIETITTRFDMDEAAAESVARLYLHQIEGLDGQDYDEDALPTEVAEFIIESIRQAQQDVTVTPLDAVATAAEQVTIAEDTLAEAKRDRDRAILAAIDAGAPIRQIALTAGMSRQAIYNIWDRRATA